MTAAVQLTEGSSSSSSGEVRVCLVPPGAAGEYLTGRIAHHLAPALELLGGKMTIEWVMEQQASGHLQIWIEFRRA